MKDFTKWTRKEFEALPTPKSYTNEEIGEVDSLVILPEKHYHDSGWRCMSFVTIQNGVPTYRISGCSDVINLGGLGGYNFIGMSDCDSSNRIKSQTVPNAKWQIDCLPVSGLLRIFSDNYKLFVGASLSDFELFYKEK